MYDWLMWLTAVIFVSVDDGEGNKMRKKRRCRSEEEEDTDEKKAV